MNMLAHLLFLIPVILLGFGGLIFWVGMLIFMRNEVVDSSNMFNWPRVVAFCAKHPEELLRMRYWSNPRGLSPFRYIRDDEYSEILEVRS